MYSCSYWWNPFIPKTMYLKQHWLGFLKVCMLAVNVYYFFIRRFCLPKCLSQLFGTFSAKKDVMKYKDRKLGIELMIFSYMSGLAFLPGGHRQFFIWFVQLVPFCFMMIGFEPIIYFNLFKNTWDHSNHGSENEMGIMHLTLLALCFYLITVGPDLYK